MCEHLIAARTFYNKTQEEIDALSPIELENYNSRIQAGDIVDRKMDGFTFGIDECLPDFYMLKIDNFGLGGFCPYYVIGCSQDCELLKRITTFDEDGSEHRILQRKWRINAEKHTYFLSLGQSIIQIPNEDRATYVANYLLDKTPA